MAKRYLFADEAGCFTFKRAPNISNYFIICTVVMNDLSVAAVLVKLRRKMVWHAEQVGDYFHATADMQSIRDQVFDVIRRHEIRIQATVCEKAKAQPSVAKSKARFYKYPWYYQFKHSIAPFLDAGDEFLITAASIGTKKERATFTRELNDVMSQTVRANWAVDFRPSQCDPCLQVADYCAWAIQRKWEMGDTRSYDLISEKITYEYELWQRGTKLYY